MANDPSDTLHLIEPLRAGDRQALTDLFQRHRDRLRRMVELHMDARLQARVDASDVLEDAFLDAAARLDGYGRPGWDRAGVIPAAADDSGVGSGTGDVTCFGRIDRSNREVPWPLDACLYACHP
jgi:hypothetical protein